MRLSSYLQDEEPFYAHGRPKEQCQQKLTDARRASRGKGFPSSIVHHFMHVGGGGYVRRIHSGYAGKKGL